MIDHVSLGVGDLDASAAFYEAVLAPLGLALLVRRTGSVGFGRKYPEFWLNERKEMARVDADTGCHVCLRAPDREAVIAFHAAALVHGGSDDGAPGDRSATMTPYFAAFVLDPDGNRIEAATFPPKQAG
jgi:catechol 2,3-dioxygenase-like lactoylglutathione lyase family enzyme